MLPSVQLQIGTGRSDDRRELLADRYADSLRALVGHRWHNQHQLQPNHGAAMRQRLQKPRTPDACPACRRQIALLPRSPGLSAPLCHWWELKSRRGAPKRIATNGFAMRNLELAPSLIRQGKRCSVA